RATRPPANCLSRASRQMAQLAFLLLRSPLRMATRRPTHSSRPKAPPPAVRGDASTPGSDSERGDYEGHEAAVRLLEAAVEPVTRAMGFEVVLIEWAGGRGGNIAR